MPAFLTGLLGAAKGGLTKGAGTLSELALPFGLDKLLGGGDPPPNFASFEAPGEITDPRQALYQALAGTFRLGQGLSQRRPTTLRSSYVQPGPAPVQVPGLGFQIGGGLGMDPALRDPSLLQQQDRGAMQFDPFQSLEGAGIPQPQRTAEPRSTRERRPR